MNRFFKDLARGKEGEALVKRTMNRRGHKVIDISNDRNYFKKDIDFIISGKYCELKTDYRISSTGNLFLENTVEYKRTGETGKGFFQTSEAEYLFYLDAHSHMLYIYSFGDLRDYVKENAKILRSAACYDSNKIVYGFLVNKDLVQHQEIQC